jgi:hypothetical protein
MEVNGTLETTALILTAALLCGCPGTMLVEAIDLGDDDSQPGDDDDSQPGDDDDLTPGDDDDLTPGDDDDATAPGAGPIADCGPFVVPQGDFPHGSAHFNGLVLAHRPEPGEDRIWSGCEVRRYFDASQQYQCQVYWSLNGPRVEWDGSTGCSVYAVEATYVPEYSDCSPSELGNDEFWLDDFLWHYGTEYHWPSSQLSLWTAPGGVDHDIPGGPPGGECGFNGPNGNDWLPWDQNIPFTNWGGPDNWEYLEFEYSVDFVPTD